LAFRRAVQLVFQHSTTSLNPAMTVQQILAEPLRLHAGLRGEAATSAAADLLAEVHMSAEFLARRPHEMSVGQRQRVALARAYAPEPALLLLDEPVAGLDATTQHDVVATLRARQRARGIAMVLVTHDIGLARSLCDRIAVMHDGRIVEAGPTPTVFDRPDHRVTRLLIDSAPLPDPRARRDARERRRRLMAEIATSPPRR
jgi:ABC-type glutathione transport system ATPase component